MFQPIIKDIDRGNNLLFGHSKVVQISYSAPSHHSFTKERIRDEIKKLMINYKGDKDLMYMVSVNTPFGFRSGKQFGKNKFISLPDDYDWEEASSFVVFVWENKKETKGGNDEKNDCLYNCICKSITKYRLPKDYKTPEKLKEYLGIKREGKINLNDISKIEDLYKININVSGDYTFTSANKHPCITIYLTLLDGHFEIDKNFNCKSSLLNGLSNNKQNLILCDEQYDKVILYDGIKIYELDYEGYFEEKYENKQNSYINGMVKEIKQNGIIEAYNKFINDVETFTEISKGKNDLSKSGFKIANEALKAIYYSLQSFKQPEPITTQEQQWLINSTKGAIIFCTPCEIEKAYSYDRNSAYPATMADAYFSFPILQGEFKQLVEIPVVLNYGIYRCEIERSVNELLDRL